MPNLLIAYFNIKIVAMLKIAQLMFQKYRDYINDNPKGYWFKAKPFGW